MNIIISWNKREYYSGKTNEYIFQDESKMILHSSFVFVVCFQNHAYLVRKMCVLNRKQRTQNILIQRFWNSINNPSKSHFSSNDTLLYYRILLGSDIFAKTDVFLMQTLHNVVRKLWIVQYTNFVSWKHI